ncbi:MAG: cellulase family glycosylhydrolase [Armatimonadetes bacterium]|nr:cellulase family glycosylhydrolase [Armatimonadota bacterium]
MAQSQPWIGFNFQWIVSWEPNRSPDPADLKALDFLAKHGFNFVRIPTDYRFWTKDYEYLKPDERVFEHIDGYLKECQERGLHMSLNMHRVPGYCINRPDIEKHNLWQDEVAQQGLAYQWANFAQRYAGVPGSELSFDLINEPPDIGQFGMTRDVHQSVIRRVVQSIRSIDPQRPVIIDGLEGGHIAVPELADLDVIHATRGYQPMPVSHQGASWWDGWKGYDAVYPGGDWWGHPWDRDALIEWYRPWRDVEAQGRTIHIGEFGCYNMTPQDVALRWLGDLSSVWREFGWGWGMWNFEGPFGIINHGREGARIETIDGYQVDRDMFELFKP